VSRFGTLKLLWYTVVSFFLTGGCT
jgi:hypothetical protein